MSYPHFLQVTLPARTLRVGARRLALHFLQTYMFLNFLASASGNFAMVLAPAQVSRSFLFFLFSALGCEFRPGELAFAFSCKVLRCYASCYASALICFMMRSERMTQ